MSDSHFAVKPKNELRFSGKLGGVSKREAERLVKKLRWCFSFHYPTKRLTWLFWGQTKLPMTHQQELLNDRLRGLVRRGLLEVIDESHFWERLGFGDSDTEIASEDPPDRSNQNVRNVY